MNKVLMIAALISIALAALIVIAMWIYTRRQFTRFADDICGYIDGILSNKVPDTFSIDEETLDSKIQMKLKQLTDVTNAARQKNIVQKQQIQESISNISHQLKTPIANLTMYNDTILNHSLAREKEIECLEIMHTQVEKLDFLVKAFMKMSRLEQNIINLKKEEGSLYDSIAEVIASTALQAEKKKLVLSVTCEPTYTLYFDIKWTTEAIFNVVENAVKYTPEGGRIDIAVERLDMFTKISIQDTGEGIEPKHINDIFKRFFRENKVHREAGAGIGLYLAKEIIMQQGGYIKVKSKEGAGSIFSVYLPNEGLLPLKEMFRN